MFTCNNIYLLSFTYYLKYILIFNIIIIPLIYLYLTFYKIIKRKIKINKTYIKTKIKSLYYVLTIVILSLIIHNTLNTNNNVCYVTATPNIYNEYRKSFYFLEDKDIDKELKNNYLENILTNKSNSTLSKLVYKEANIIIENKEEEIKDVEEQPEEVKEDNFLHETDTNIQNSVYVIDGVFYYPTYIYGNNNTYSGMFCPSNPLEEGFNNSYGYNNYFYTRLERFIEDARQNGYTITISTQGCRKYSTQNYYYSTMDSGRAAAPGHSLHGFGIASDLEFYQSDGSICPYYRNDSSCPSMGWAHSNAYKYGLSFPLLNASYKEDWHVEPINKIKY